MTVNWRGNEPGTGTPQPVRREEPTEARGRGITPGTLGQAPPEKKATDVSVITAPNIIDQGAVDVVRKMNAIYCVVRGCTWGEDGGPRKVKSITGLRNHLRHRHKGTDYSLVIRTTQALLREQEDA
jgi:hypothetical protein